MKKIEFYQFHCSIDYLKTFYNKTRSGSIFITNISGIDCNNLCVTFIMVSTL